MIKIKAKKDGFRRCGTAHAATWTEWPDDRWTPEELAIFAADPMLVVVVEPEGNEGQDDESQAIVVDAHEAAVQVEEAQVDADVAQPTNLSKKKKKGAE